MKRTLGLVSIAALATSVLVSAKGPTSRITIVDTLRGTSTDITDPVVLSRFTVWDGPGTYSTTNGQTTEGRDGFIADWRSGPLDSRPPGLTRYEVRFFVRHNTDPVERLAYTVFYERDPSSGNGFVYVPGKTDEQYRLNVASILRGSRFEGRWFRANQNWLDATSRLRLSR